MDNESNFVLHVLICENDDLIMDILCSYVKTFSKELGFDVMIHKCYNMPINPQKVFHLCSYMNLVIINAKFDGQGTSICQNLLKNKVTLPVILVSDKRAVPEQDIFLIGVISTAIEYNLLKLFFYRAIGQLLCEMQLQRQRLHIRIGLTKVMLDFDSIISLQKVGVKVEVKSTQGTYLADASLKALKEKLPKQFIYMNKKTIINSNWDLDRKD